MIALKGYENIKPLHREPHARMFSATHTRTARQVILKHIANGAPSRANQIEGDYQRLRRISSDHVAKVYSLEKISTTGQEDLILVYEYAQGDSLKDHLAQNQLSIGQALHIGLQLTAALADLHTKGLTHKGLRPLGININSLDQTCKITDFEIATPGAFADHWLHYPDISASILPYIAPEQTGRTARVVDYRADIYALGVILYECLTGRPPFAMDDPYKLIHAHLAADPAKPSDIDASVPRIVSKIVMKLLAKAPEDRYQSAWGVKADLERCRDQLRVEGIVTPFALASRDIPHILRMPQKLYGRQLETDRLLAAFERVSQGSTEMMLTTGQAGIGKSALVDEIRRRIVQKQGYFISGKFDQMKRDIPYAPLIQAFGELLGYILAESKDRIAGWKEKLLVALGSNGQVVIDVIPELELIVGKQPKVPGLGPVESQNRFNYVFGRFIHAFANNEHPLALFLDDLQWADSSSLDLLKVFMAAGTKHLFLIGAYRDSEVQRTHPVMLMKDELLQTGAIVNTINLGFLDEKNVNQLIAETLGSEPTKTEGLAQLCIAKTGGNPFFLNQFVHSLHHEKLIEFDSRQLVWKWNAEKIGQTEVTGNVVDFIAAKIQRFSHPTQHILKLAACIGSEFDLKTLAAVHAKSTAATIEDLRVPLQEELIIPLGDTTDLLPVSASETGRWCSAAREGLIQRINPAADALAAENIAYKFVHDRVQQAAYSLITDKPKKEIHLQVGRSMLQNFSEVNRGEHIFDIVNQLNLGAELIDDREERANLAELNLMAGKKAKTTAAFGPAFKYLKTGIKLLENKGWDARYDLTMALYEEAAEGALLNGRFDEMDRLVNVVLNQAHDVLDKVKVYEVKIQACVIQNKLLEAVKNGLFVLKLLGVKFPKKPNTFHILFGLLKTRLSLVGKRTEDLVDLPQMTDPYMVAAIRIIVRLGTPIYLAVPELFPLIVFKGINLSVKHGNAPESAATYVAYGIVLCGALGRMDSGYQFGQAGMELLMRLNANRVEARTIATFNITIRHWKRHLDLTIPSLFEAYQKGLESGDLEIAGYAILMHCQNSYFSGKGLARLDVEMERNSTRMAQIKQETSLHYNQLYHQAILNLMGRNENPIRLIGRCYDEEKMLPVHMAVKDESAICDLYLNKLILSYLFYEYGEGIRNGDLAEKHLEAVLSMPNVPIFYFYDALTRLAYFPAAAKPEQKRLLRKVSRNQKKMKKWARFAPMNYLHKYHLVEAELARVSAKFNKAMDHYDQAIALAQKNQFLQEEALANECAALFFLAQSKDTIAAAYMRNARKGYLTWGAHAKVKHLETAHTQLLKNSDQAFGETAVGRTCIDKTASGYGFEADLISVIKAVRTIAGEQDLARLLDQLMAIVIENAGARKGYLILKRDGRFLIEARVSTNEAAPTDCTPEIEACDDLSSAVIHYVIRTGKDVLLDNAVNEGRFCADPYISEKKIRSILCMPIADQGRMTGVLYLENRRIAGAFTPERVEVLRTVSEILANAWARREAEENLLAHREQLRSLSSQMLLTEERERRRIAIDLHDRIGHALSNIMLRLGAAKQESTLSTSDDRLEEIGAIVEQCIEDTHTLTFDISPPILYDLGLEAALDWLVEQTRTDHGIKLHFEDDEQPKPLDESIRVLLFQATRELVFNMVKHSRAASGKVSVSRNGQNIRIVIQDDGVGFDPAAVRYDANKKGGFGLFSIRERLTQQAGRFTVESSPGQGTMITIESPMTCGEALN